MFEKYIIHEYDRYFIWDQNVQNILKIGILGTSEIVVSDKIFYQCAWLDDELRDIYFTPIINKFKHSVLMNGIEIIDHILYDIDEYLQSNNDDFTQNEINYINDNKHEIIRQLKWVKYLLPNELNSFE